VEKVKSSTKISLRSSIPRAMAEGPADSRETGGLHPLNVDILPGTNVATHYAYSLGDVEKGFSESERSSKTHSMSIRGPLSMETHAAVAQVAQGSERFTVWSSTDRPYYMARNLPTGWGLLEQDPDISNYTGAVRGKEVGAEPIAAALARFAGGRPVKVVFSRGKNLQHPTHAMPASSTSKQG